MAYQSPFLQGIREEMRMRGYSIRTEKTYLYWIKAFIRFHHKRHPAEMGQAEVAQFLTFIANQRNVAINTQKTALNALVYLYHKHLHQELGSLGFHYASKQRFLPVVLTVGEVKRILNCLEGRSRLIVEMLYGSGLRISECLRLRIQDVDLEHLSLTVRDGKGRKDRKDRKTLLSQHCATALQSYINSATALQQKDNLQGLGPSLPYALGRKYPNAFRKSIWMFVFPSHAICHHPITGVLCRHHLHQSVVRKALAVAVAKSGVNKRVTCHTFRHSFIKYFPVFSPSGQRSCSNSVPLNLCHSSFAGRLRYPHCAGIAWSQR
nr:integron integrase [Shewanella jiangmenensis]